MFIAVIPMALTLISVHLARASEVSQVLADQVFIIMTMEKTGEWNTDDRVCIYRDKERMACGLIVQTTPKAAKVKIMEQFKTVKTGDTIAADTRDRNPSSIDGATSSLSVTPERVYKYDLLVGVKQNLSSAIPFVHLQIYSNPHLALGIQVDRVAIRMPDSTNIVSAVGAFFAANYYGDGAFRGFWFQGGTGFHVLPAASTGLSTSSYAPSFVGLIGWRNKWALGMNVGIGLGVQYFLAPQGITADFLFNPLQPLLSIDIGFNI
jgi:hypothetical protein